MKGFKIVKGVIILLLVLLFVNKNQAQPRQERDSLKLLLLTDMPDSSRINTLDLLARSYHPKQLDSMLFYANRLQTFAEQTNNVTGEAKALLIEELYAKANKDHKKAIEKNQEVLDLLANTGDLKLAIKAHINMGKSQLALLELETSEASFTKAIELSKQLDDMNFMAESVNNLAVQYYYHMNEFDRALELLLPVINSEREKEILPEIVAPLYNTVASIYMRLNKREKAVVHYLKSYEAISNSDNYLNQIAILANTGLVYRSLGKNVESRKWLMKAQEISERHNIKNYEFQLLQGIGYSYYNVKEYNKALSYFEKIVEIAEKGGKTATIVDSYRSLAGAYFYLNRYDESKAILEKAKGLTHELKGTPRNYAIMSVVYKYLSVIDSAQQDFKGSLENYKKYIALEDSISLQKQKEKIAEMEVAYETEKKDKEIELLTAENDLQKEYTKRQQNLKLGLLVGSILLLLLLFVAYNRYLVKKKAVTTISIKKEAIEEKNKENELLIKEIHHRVKNNLQIILSLLNAQTHATEGNQQAYDIIIESQNKIKSMALIHENLYRGDKFAKIPTQSYFKDLIAHIEDSYQDAERQISIQSNIEENEINMALAVPLGLIVNELVTNAYKYAFNNGRRHRLTNIITINFKKSIGQNFYELQVIDNGNGLPVNFEIEDSKTFGLQMINGLVKQLEGKIELNRSNGTSFNIFVQDVEAA